MRAFAVSLAALVWASSGNQVRVVDLSEIDRTIRKEPVYRSKVQGYCLLVFGPEAKTRVWLVLDGDVLYVDRKGNGDLTDKAGRIEAQRTTATQDDFVVGTIAGGAERETYSNIDVTRYGKDRRLVIGADIGGKYRLQAMYDLGGCLQFADRPQDASVVHFGGPLTMCLSRPVEFVPGQQEEIYVKVGTPGLGKGTFAALPHDAVPKGLKALVEIEFPSKEGSGKPIRDRYEIAGRC